MQVIIVSKNSSRSRVLKLGPFSLLGMIVAVLVTLVMTYHVGHHQAKDLTRSSLETLYSQTTPVWTQEIEAQQILVDQAQENAEKNLDALATRLSKLQAHILRLDALGSRLAAMADIEDISFDLESTPGIGGPKPDRTLDTMQVNDFLAELAELDLKINDRSEKLSAMESMLIDRTLHSQTMPVGKPTNEGWLSSLFGKRNDPITGKVEFHEGVDYAGRIGSPIISVASGIVTWSGVRYGYGNMVEINHGNGYLTRYAHNQKNLVVVGQKVEKGQKIALMGASGRATGSHVHFEVVLNGKPVNPRKLRSLN